MKTVSKILILAAALALAGCKDPRDVTWRKYHEIKFLNDTHGIRLYQLHLVEERGGGCVYIYPVKIGPLETVLACKNEIELVERVNEELSAKYPRK